jgi:signal transduction histidine kinase
MISSSGKRIDGSLCTISIFCGDNLHTILFLRSARTMNDSLLRLTPFGQMFTENKIHPLSLKVGNSLLSAERKLNSCNNEQIPVQISGALLQAVDNQHIDGAVLITHDLRKRIRLESERAEQANRLSYQEGLAEMSANVLHNIGNAVAGLNGRAEMIHATTKHIQQVQLQLEQASSLDNLEQLQGGLQKLSEILKKLHHKQLLPSSQALTEGILHIADIITTQQQAAFGHSSINTHFDIKEVLEKVVNLHQESNQRYLIDTTLEVDPALSEVNLPQNQFIQLIGNLIKNSREAIIERIEHQQQENTTASHSIHIQLNATEADHFILQVKDSGVGIPEEKLQSIFQRNITTKVNGSGIGLHASSTFVQSIQGTIQAHSDGLNRGTTLIIKLPIDGSKTSQTINKERDYE